MKVNPQGISRVLRKEGYNPQSTGDSRSRWVALLCKKSGDDVRVRVWSDYSRVEPDAEDRDTAREIAELLKTKGYIVRYEPGAYCLYVEGKA